MRVFTTLSVLAVLLSFFCSVSLAKDEDDDGETLPIGETSQKLKFQYQSEKKKGSRIYRVRNTPKGLLTPVLWKLKEETFIDVTLPKCEEMGPGDWVETIVTTSLIGKGETSLSYGLNKDEFTDMPLAFIREQPKAADKKRDTPRRLATRIKGSIVDSRQRTIYIDVEVSSELVREVGELRVKYGFSFGPRTEAVLLDTGNKKTYGSDLRLVWESPAQKAFNEGLKQWDGKKLDETTRGVSVRLKDFRSVKVVEKRLLIMQGEKKIASVTAPAHFPEDYQR